MLIPADAQLFGTIAIGALVLILAVIAVLWKLGVDARRILSEREWIIAAKLAGIALMGLLLYQAAIAFDFPAESFIYGRF